MTKNSLRKYANGMKGLTPRDQRLMVSETHYSAISVMSTEGILRYSERWQNAGIREKLLIANSQALQLE